MTLRTFFLCSVPVGALVAFASCTKHDAAPEDAHVAAPEDASTPMADATAENLEPLDASPEDAKADAFFDARSDAPFNAQDGAPLRDASTEEARAAMMELFDASAKGSFLSYKNILHIGDSTVGYRMGLTMELKKMLEDLGVHYTSWSVTSAGLRSFADDRVVEKWIKKTSPDLVIVQLGTNNVTVPHPEAYTADLKNILEQVGTLPCYWIGPISLQFPERGMRGFLREHVSPCTFFDSYDLTLARQSDGLHPSQKAAKIWADAFWVFANTHPPTDALRSTLP